MRNSFFYVFIALFSVSVLAQEATIKKRPRKVIKQSSSDLSNRSTQEKKVKKHKVDDPDSLITNKKLRAESGAKSRFSVSTQFNYLGGSLQKPFDSRRPNIKASTATSGYSALSANVSLKWNITKLDSLSAGVGMSAIAPFATEVPKEAGKRYQVADPYINYQHLDKIYGVQTVFTFGALLYTTDDVRNEGNLFEVGPTLTLAYDFNGSPFTLGVWSLYTHRFFDKDTTEVVEVDEDKDIEGGTISYLAGYYQNDFSVGTYPFLEYQINDTFNLRTLWGLWVYDHPRVEDRISAYKRNKVYQSIGLGISITRDIYLYPFVQFIPDDMRSERTNLAVNANINL